MALTSLMFCVFVVEVYAMCCLFGLGRGWDRNLPCYYTVRRIDQLSYLTLDLFVLLNHLCEYRLEILVSSTLCLRKCL